MHKDLERVLISKEEIQQKVKELAKQITEDFKGEQLTVVCILKGSTIFFADLVREIELDTVFDFMIVKSYGGGTESSGNVRFVKDLDESITGKNVLIVEDIIDSGLTLTFLKNNLILTTGELSNKIGYKNYKMKNQTIANAVNYTYTYKANGKSYHLRGVKLTHSRHLRKRVEIVYLRGFPRCAYEGHFSGIMESLLAISLTAMGMLLLAIYLFVA